ncbi:MAG: 5'/3'-nucleotidase SurE [Bacteroidales bacterium]
MKDDLLILVSNDDGIDAKGLKCLIDVAVEFGEVVVAAPAEAMSGMSHAITIKTPLRVKKVYENGKLSKYSCLGTPVDSVKLALNKLLDRRPDIVLSGINHGSNSSASVVYSGTMAAAMEGCVNQIPSAGFSLLDYDHDADFSYAKEIVRKVVSGIIQNGLEKGVCLNVNIPAKPENEIKGIKICRQARGYWKEEFDRRKDPHNGEYYWLTGQFFNVEPDSEDTDEFALNNDFVSIVPIRIDLTHYESITKLNNWGLDEN